MMVVIIVASIFYLIISLIKTKEDVDEKEKMKVEGEREEEEDDITSRNKIKILNIILHSLAILSSLIIILINLILIARLNPSLKTKIGPEHIRMGFFNQNEIELIQSGQLNRNDDVNDERKNVIGRLSDLLESTNNDNKRQHGKFLRIKFKVFNSDFDKDERKKYLFSYRFEIECSSQKQIINEKSIYHDDCKNATSLTVQVKYFEDGPYPTYNCVINRGESKCASNCTNLIESSYRLIVFQHNHIDEENGHVLEAAWTGLSKYKIQPRIDLTFDESINPCVSFSMRRAHFDCVLIFLNLFLIVLN